MGMPIIVNSGVTRCEAITDIVESVALEQAALAHILNAEGEKLQAIIKQGNSEEIIETNNSVRQMVESVARLELILQSKLGLFENCLCEECTMTETKTETITRTETATLTKTETLTATITAKE